VSQPLHTQTFARSLGDDTQGAVIFQDDGNDITKIPLSTGANGGAHIGFHETLVAHRAGEELAAIPDGTIAGYFPDLNPLVALLHHDRKSKTPASKVVPVRIETT